MKENENGRIAKASCELKPGDILEITFGEKPVKVKVTGISEHVLKNDASSLYEILS